MGKTGESATSQTDWGTVVAVGAGVIAAAAATVEINRINRSRVKDAPKEKAVSSFRDNKFTRQRIT